MIKSHEIHIFKPLTHVKVTGVTPNVDGKKSRQEDFCIYPIFLSNLAMCNYVLQATSWDN